MTTVRILDTASDLVLDLSSTNGYTVIRDIETTGRIWNRQITSSPSVDGDDDDAHTLAAATFSFSVLVEGSGWAQVQTRWQALLTAVEQRVWLLEITLASGVTEVWRASRADSGSPLPQDTPNRGFRIVNLSVRVQPTATFTGI